MSKLSDKAFNNFFSIKLLSLLNKIQDQQAINSSIYFDNKFLNLHQKYYSKHTLLTDSQKVYTYMSNYHRNEYLFKNEYFNQIYLPKLLKQAKNTNLLIKEWYVNRSWLDLAEFKLDSIPHVIEIKSDLDSIERLPKQLGNYYMTFLKVSVFCSVKLLNQVLDLAPNSTGILILDRNNKIRRLRDAQVVESIYQPEKAFNIIDSAYKMNLLKGQVLPLKNTLRYQKELTAFKKLSNYDQQLYINNCFMHRKDLLNNEYLKSPDRLLNVPYQLRYLYYFYQNK